MPEVVPNRRDEGRDALERPPANAVPRDLAEPAFYEIQPGTAGGNEMKVHAGMPAQPSLDRWTFVRAQVVQDHVNRVVDWSDLIDPIEKSDKLLGIAFRSALAQDDPVEQPQGRIQTRRAVADVIVRLVLGDAGRERQHGPRPIQGLNSGFAAYCHS